MDTCTKNNYEEENGGERGDDVRDDTIASPKDLGLVCVSRKFQASISSISGTTEETPPSSSSKGN